MKTLDQLKTASLFILTIMVWSSCENTGTGSILSSRDYEKEAYEAIMFRFTDNNSKIIRNNCKIYPFKIDSLEITSIELPIVKGKVATNIHKGYWEFILEENDEGNLIYKDGNSGGFKKEFFNAIMNQ